MGHRVIMWPVATSVCPRPDQGAQVREIERIGFGWAFARAVNMPSEGAQRTVNYRHTETLSAQAISSGSMANLCMLRTPPPL